MRILFDVVLISFLALPPVSAGTQTSTASSTVLVESGKLQLRALLWRPEGKGPFPAILFCHGDGRVPYRSPEATTAADLQQLDIVGPAFAKHGYVLLLLFRRGQGLSADQGESSGDLLKNERNSKGEDAANRLQVKLLETQQLDDARAGLAYLRNLQGVNPHGIGVIGHSFGGSLSLVLAEHDKSLSAVIDFAGAAKSWERSWYLRAQLSAVRRLKSPVFFIHAENDYSVVPGKTLDGEMEQLGKPHRLKVFPACGQTRDEGHNFVFLCMPNWEEDVLFSIVLCDAEFCCSWHELRRRLPKKHKIQ